MPSKTELKKFDKPTVLVGGHAETAFNTGDPDTDRAKGTKFNIGLTRAGFEAANADARKLSAYAIKEVHHGTMLRSKQTVAPILTATGAKEVATEALDPWDIGYLSGQLRKEIADRIDYYI